MSLTAWALDNPTRWARVRRAPAVVVGLLLLGGCVSTIAGARDVASTARVAASASATPTVTTSAPAPAPTSASAAPVVADEHAHTPVPSAAPRDAARALALRFVGAWARPDLSTVAWRAAVQPLSTEQFARALGTVDPANTPAARVAGPAVEQGELGMPDAAVYVVPLSDRSRVQVTVALVDAGWRVDGILPVSAS